MLLEEQQGHSREDLIDNFCTAVLEQLSKYCSHLSWPHFQKKYYKFVKRFRRRKLHSKSLERKGILKIRDDQLRGEKYLLLFNLVKGGITRNSRRRSRLTMQTLLQQWEWLTNKKEEIKKKKNLETITWFCVFSSGVWKLGRDRLCSVIMTRKCNIHKNLFWCSAPWKRKFIYLRQGLYKGSYHFMNHSILKSKCGLHTTASHF